ncbi:MAG: TetR/AcrR family transcriptional regulator [Opitutales bacterium]
MAHKQETKILIIETAIEVLRTSGTEGLTLRKVATQASISLGNLQYHFKDKPALFAGLGGYYFGQCAALLDQYEGLDDSKSIEKKLRHLILFYLDHLDELTDMCRIFRELWALATRDIEVQQQLNDYYRLTVEKLEAIVSEMGISPKLAREIVILLLPYFEGYSITHDSLAYNKTETAKLLTRLSMELVE